MTLVCPFLDESSAYAAGVELGLLFSRMKEEECIEDYFTLLNQDQILLLASRRQWKIQKLKNFGKDWFYLKMKRQSVDDADC